MNTKEKFDEMVAYDFSNLNLQQNANDNCYDCHECDGCDSNCDRCDANCDKR